MAIRVDSWHNMLGYAHRQLTSYERKLFRDFEGALDSELLCCSEGIDKSRGRVGLELRFTINIGTCLSQRVITELVKVYRRGGWGISIEQFSVARHDPALAGSTVYFVSMFASADLKDG